jgi:CRP-like cAMP-binding protein
LKDPHPHIPTLLARLPLFRGLGDEQLAQLAGAAQERCCGKDEVIFNVGEQPSGLFIVTAGLVKEACMSSEGREKILELFDAPQSFGEAALFLDAPYTYYAAALGPTRLLHIDKTPLFEVAFSQPKIAQRLLRVLSKRELALVRDVEAYASRRHVQRVACYLLGRCSEDETDRVDIVLPATKQTIAARLGMTPETLSRNLHDLADAGLITVNGDLIRLLDITRLRLFAL